MNTAEQKGKELIEKFMPLVYRGESKYNLPQAKEAKKNAKKAALICVDAMFDRYPGDSFFLHEVKQYLLTQK